MSNGQDSFQSNAIPAPEEEIEFDVRNTLAGEEDKLRTAAQKIKTKSDYDSYMSTIPEPDRERVGTQVKGFVKEHRREEKIAEVQQSPSEAAIFGLDQLKRMQDGWSAKSQGAAGVAGKDIITAAGFEDSLAGAEAARDNPVQTGILVLEREADTLRATAPKAAESIDSMIGEMRNLSGTPRGQIATFLEDMVVKIGERSSHHQQVQDKIVAQQAFNDAELKRREAALQGAKKEREAEFEKKRMEILERQPSASDSPDTVKAIERLKGLVKNIQVDQIIEASAPVHDAIKTLTVSADASGKTEQLVSPIQGKIGFYGYQTMKAMEAMGGVLAVPATRELLMESVVNLNGVDIFGANEEAWTRAMDILGPVDISVVGMQNTINSYKKLKYRDPVAFIDSQFRQPNFRRDKTLQMKLDPVMDDSEKKLYYESLRGIDKLAYMDVQTTKFFADRDTDINTQAITIDAALTEAMKDAGYLGSLGAEGAGRHPSPVSIQEMMRDFFAGKSYRDISPTITTRDKKEESSTLSRELHSAAERVLGSNNQTLNAFYAGTVDLKAAVGREIMANAKIHAKSLASDHGSTVDSGMVGLLKLLGSNIEGGDLDRYHSAINSASVYDAFEAMPISQKRRVIAAAEATLSNIELFDAPRPDENPIEASVFRNYMETPLKANGKSLRMVKSSLEFFAKNARREAYGTAGRVLKKGDIIINERGEKHEVLQPFRGMMGPETRFVR